MAKSNGGPAFPRPIGWNGLDRDEHASSGSQGGMSLRDYFAAAALTGLLATEVDTAVLYEDSARMAYEQADAMLKERAKGGAA